MLQDGVDYIIKTKNLGALKSVAPKLPGVLKKCKKAALTSSR